jgi:UDP-N-acetylglucosamine--N-acetylmuramyl-(pentapeptide) pyrophosphoryl-undecaprenol N-acetylglucosamine transferase
MKILLAGGGTLGPVTPLLALVEAWRARGEVVEFVFVGTPNGPERVIVQDQYHLPFLSILPVRFPRFFSLEWVLLPFRVVWVMWQSWQILVLEKPEVIVGAGGFTQVPLVIVGWMLKIPSVILQTDVHPLLSTRFCAPFVRQIFVAWSETTGSFPSHKTRVMGIPVRQSLASGSKKRALARFRLDGTKRTMLVFGGGTGSLWINERMAEIASQLKREINVIHILGRGKGLSSSENGHVAVEYLKEGMEDAYAVADLVVCRGGLGTISELSALRKSAIIIPLPNSAQEKNALLLERHEAARILSQSETTSAEMLEEIRWLMNDAARRQRYGEHIGQLLKTDVAYEMIVMIETLVKKKTRH